MTSVFIQTYHIIIQQGLFSALGLLFDTILYFYEIYTLVKNSLERLLEFVGKIEYSLLYLLFLYLLFFYLPTPLNFKTTSLSNFRLYLNFSFMQGYNLLYNTQSNSISNLVFLVRSTIEQFNDFTLILWTNSYSMFKL